MASAEPGAKWKTEAIPKYLPPSTTIHDYFRRWTDDGTLNRLHQALYIRCREQTDREANPTAAIIDSQSVKSAEKGGASIDPPGYDAGKKIKGKKRYLLVDTEGLLLLAIIHAANIQDRDGGILLMAALLKEHPLLRKLYADGGYQGKKFCQALRRILRKVKVEIVKRSDATKGFAVLPRRWVVERTIAWLNRCRRLAKDWECLNGNARAFLQWASVRLMLRRLCKVKT